MGEKQFVSGWKTLADGTREPMTANEADALMRHVEEKQAQQAKAYPTTYHALRAYIDAEERMRALGWRTNIFDLQEGDELAVAERGSTGIFRAFWQKPYIHYHDCVSQMGKHYIKRVSDLSPDELATMERCSADHAEFMRHQVDTMARLQSIVDSGDGDG